MGLSPHRFPLAIAENLHLPLISFSLTTTARSACHTLTRRFWRDAPSNLQFVSDLEAQFNVCMSGRSLRRLVVPPPQRGAEFVFKRKYYVNATSFRHRTTHCSVLQV